jgi:RNA polymerase sigma-70 factor, ECF subfamily
MVLRRNWCVRVIVMDEKELIQSASKGDLEAFNNLVLAYQDQVYTLAYYILLNPQAADNITQKAFKFAFQKIRQFRGGSFQVWLLRIVVNLCFEEPPRENFPIPDPLGHSKSNLNEIVTICRSAGQGESINQEGKLAEAWQDLLSCLHRLPPMVRLPVILVDVQHLDYADASAIMGVPTGVLKRFLSRGRVIIRQSYSQSIQRENNNETFLGIIRI